MPTSSTTARKGARTAAGPPPRATYVYSVIANRTTPVIPPALKGLPHAGPVRLVAVDRGLWLVVSDVPLAHYAELPLAKRLGDLDWVSRAALAHERVVEALRAAAVLPMKLFTIFSSDLRAVEHVARERSSIDALVARVTGHDEWGVRVLFAPGRQQKAKTTTPRSASTGAGYLRQKKAHRDAAVERLARAAGVVAALYDGLAERASDARRRTSSELPAANSSLLLDAAMLVPRARAAQFRAAVAREARTLAGQGYRVSLTGPWPPYSFLTD